MWVRGLGKIVTIYLSDEEAKELKEFCDENQCTQYSALKTAVKQLLSRPVQTGMEADQEIIKEPYDVQIPEGATNIEELPNYCVRYDLGEWRYFAKLQASDGIGTCRIIVSKATGE